MVGFPEFHHECHSSSQFSSYILTFYNILELFITYSNINDFLILVLCHVYTLNLLYLILDRNV